MKTFVINHINSLSQKDESVPVKDICASYTKAVVSSLLKRVKQAIEMTGYKTVVLAGGVSANSHLRAAFGEYCKKKGLDFYVPPVGLCGDNAAMIGAQGYYEYLEGNVSDESLNAYCTHREFQIGHNKKQ